MMTLPAPMLAEADIGQVIFIIVFLVVGFIQWVIKVLKEKAEAAERARRVPTQEEIEARNRTWEQQTQPVAPPEPPPTHGGTLDELLGELRKAMGEPPMRPVPPPLPPPPAAVRTTVPQQVAKSGAAIASEPAVPQAPATVVAHRPIATRRRHPATAMLHTAEGYQHAFVLREVLGPPRAFHDFSGPED